MWRVVDGFLASRVSLCLLAWLLPVMSWTLRFGLEQRFTFTIPLPTLTVTCQKIYHTTAQLPNRKLLETTKSSFVLATLLSSHLTPSTDPLASHSRSCFTSRFASFACYHRHAPISSASCITFALIHHVQLCEPAESMGNRPSNYLL